MISTQQENHYHEKNIEFININQLILEAQRGNSIAIEDLIKRYDYLVQFHCSKYYIKGSELDDLIQEARIGLFKAIKDYNPQKQTNFNSFASLCIKRQLFSAMTASVRKKHQIHLQSMSLFTTLSYDNDGNEKYLIDILINDSAHSPETELLLNELFTEIKKTMAKSLSNLEQTALQLFCEGFSYQEISELLSRNFKSIDASIYRAKEKLKSSFSFLLK